MYSRFKITRVFALALAAAFAVAGWAPARARVGGGQGQPQQQQQPKPKATPQDADEAIDDDDVVRFETDLANVLFTAVDRNKRFVTTIKKEDVRVLEDGVEQDVFTFQRETDRPLSLAILVDVSASQERTLPEEKSAAQRFVDAVIRSRRDEVAVLSFTGDATLEQGLTGNASNVRRAIDRIEFVPPSGYIGGGTVINVPGTTPPISGDNQRRAGSTAIWDAVWVTSRDVLSETSDKTRRAIILLTDGVDTSSRLKMSEAIDSALKADAIIYSIGIGDDFFSGVEESSLRQLSERTGGRAYFPRDETDLRAAFSQIQEELRSQYLLAYSPKNKAKDGTFRKVLIEVVNPDLQKQKLRLTYRQGYFAQSAAAPTPRRKE
ncbi:MAG TPA: VWA domain-containing protein [Pyrinomonadaceae bacterium]|nr:VWA domain-containing protein [Pyrinomonadaceae bacterium]